MAKRKHEIASSSSTKRVKQEAENQSQSVLESPPFNGILSPFFRSSQSTSADPSITSQSQLSSYSFVAKSSSVLPSDITAISISGDSASFKKEGVVGDKVSQIIYSMLKYQKEYADIWPLYPIDSRIQFNGNEIQSIDWDGCYKDLLLAGIDFNDDKAVDKKGKKVRVLKHLKVQKEFDTRTLGKTDWELILEEMEKRAADIVASRTFKNSSRNKLNKAFFKSLAKESKPDKIMVTLQKKGCAQIARIIKDFWNQISKIVIYRHNSKLEEVKNVEIKKHLDKVVDETEHLSALLAEDFHNEQQAPAQKVSSLTVLLQDKGIDDNEIDEEHVENDLEESDDEETIAEAENDTSVFKSAAEEEEKLHKEQNLPIEIILQQYQKEKESISDSDSSEYDEIDNDAEKEYDENGNEITDGKTIAERFAAKASAFQPTGLTLNTTVVKTPVPFLIKGTLREYQQIGLDWLASLYDKHLNGILADEMGLGKTVMTISLLAHLACNRSDWGPHLIIVPSSLVLNWELEFKKWCPSFKLLVYFGSPKERQAKRVGWSRDNAFHVCITSYKLVTQDQSLFKRMKWSYMILDEAQNIKNFKSQRWLALLHFHTRSRLLLTGTPLQNSVMELWSLMHFLMPNVFQSHAEFQQWFSTPLTQAIESNTKSAETQALIQRLHSILRPFILRRMKRDVEKQLPPKIHHTIYCSLSRRQQYLYEEFISSTETQNTLKGSSFFGIVGVLMQLRKVCNHPDLFAERPIESPFDCEQLVFNFPSLCNRIRRSRTFDLLTHQMDFYPNQNATFCNQQTNRTGLIQVRNNLNGKWEDVQSETENDNDDYFDTPLLHDYPIPWKMFSLSSSDFDKTESDILLPSYNAFKNSFSKDFYSEENKKFVYDQNTESLLPISSPFPPGINNFPDLSKSSIRSFNTNILKSQVSNHDYCEAALNSYKHNQILAQEQPIYPNNFSVNLLIKPTMNLLQSSPADIISYFKQPTILKEPEVYAPLVEEDDDIVMPQLVEEDDNKPEIVKLITPQDISSDYLALSQFKASNSSFFNCLFPSLSKRVDGLYDFIDKWCFYVPSTRALPPVLTSSNSNEVKSTSGKKCHDSMKMVPSFSSKESIQFQFNELHKILNETLFNLFHSSIIRHVLRFPDKRLLQYDCGKLRSLAVLLRKLESENHRCLIFTQMTRVLDILESFVNLHRYTYLRLDGATKLEKRQLLIERFNRDKKIFLFLLSTRSGGFGLNLTGADTVIFYDSDWNPAMDAQAQDRCHRIGQTREVHIYRLVTSHTIEENIIKKASQKRQLNRMVIKDGGFTTDFFKNLDLSDLINYKKNKEQNIIQEDKEVIEYDNDEQNDVNPNDLLANSNHSSLSKSGPSQEELEKILAKVEDASDVVALKTAKQELYEENITNDFEDEKEETNQEDDPLLKELNPLQRYGLYFLEKVCPLFDEKETQEIIRKTEEEYIKKDEQLRIDSQKRLAEIKHEKHKKFLV